MSLFYSEPSLTAHICRNLGSIPRLFSRIPTKPTSLIPQRCTISLRRGNNLSLSLAPAQSLYCSKSSGSSSMEPNSLSPTAIFVKGLPQSTSEGTLTNAFSKFGEVSRVKIITYEKSKGTSGFAYVWFVNGECAENAVLEMNGKRESQFFEGRFILVEMAKAGSCKTRRDGGSGTPQTTPYRF